MKPISREVLASISSEGMGEMATRIKDKIAYLVVDNKEYKSDGVLLEPKGELCGFCRREKGERDLIISGHTVSICLECFASLNST
jgi:hypothetical protein